MKNTSGMVSLGDWCEENGLDPRQQIEAARMLNDLNVFEANRRMVLLNKYSKNPRNEMLPLTEDGYEWGRVVSRVPLDIGLRFMQQRNFGQEGFCSDEGQKDLLKAYPQCAVKTVSGKVQGVGFGSGRRERVGTYQL